MDVAITGSHGLIGRALSRSLRADGHRVIPITRPRASAPDHDPRTDRRNADAVTWDPSRGTIDRAGLAGIDAVVHLAGEGIAARRWTDAHRARVLDSRVQGTTVLTQALAETDGTPRVLVSGSAVGYYGDRGDEDLVETSPPGDDFLADVCQAWEGATTAAVAAGVRVARIRTGIVLSPEGGMLPKVLLPARLGLGGPAGNGEQWLSWISLADEVRAIRFLLDHELSGPYNLTSPHPTTSAGFAKVLGRTVHRPAVLRIPRLVTKLPLGIGPLAESLLFSGAKVRPAALVDAGFTFADPDLDVALATMVDRH